MGVVFRLSNSTNVSSSFPRHCHITMLRYDAHRNYMYIIVAFVTALKCFVVVIVVMVLHRECFPESCVFHCGHAFNIIVVTITRCITTVVMMLY